MGRKGTPVIVVLLLASCKPAGGGGEADVGPAPTRVGPDEARPAGGAPGERPVPEGQPSGGADETAAAPVPRLAPDIGEPDERGRLEGAFGFPLYPGGRRVVSLSQETPTELRIVLTTEDAPERVVRFYEGQTGKIAQVTELSDGNIHDIILESESQVRGGVVPIYGIQVRPTPKWHLREGITGRTSIILFRRLP